MIEPVLCSALFMSAVTTVPSRATMAGLGLLGGRTMKPLKFIVMLVGGVMAVWSTLTGSQPAEIPAIGLLSSRASSDSGPMLDAFRGGLAKADYIEGQNVSIEYR
jgi:hypothetical protein